MGHPTHPHTRPPSRLNACNTILKDQTLLRRHLPLPNTQVRIDLPKSQQKNIRHGLLPRLTHRRIIAEDATFLGESRIDDGQVGGLYLESCARGGGGDGHVDCWGGLGREVGEEFGDAGKWGRGLEEIVLGADFGGPFVIIYRQLGPVEELEHALVSAVQLASSMKRAEVGAGGVMGTLRPLLCCFALTLHGKSGLLYEWRMLL